MESIQWQRIKWLSVCVAIVGASLIGMRPSANDKPACSEDIITELALAGLNLKELKAICKDNQFFVDSSLCSKETVLFIEANREYLNTFGKSFSVDEYCSIKELDSAREGNKYAFEEYCPGNVFKQDRYRVCKALFRSLPTGESPGNGTREATVLLRSRILDISNGIARSIETNLHLYYWAVGVLLSFAVAAVFVAIRQEAWAGRARTLAISFTIIVVMTMTTLGFDKKYQSALIAHQGLIALRDNIDVTAVQSMSHDQPIQQAKVEAWLKKYDDISTNFAASYGESFSVPDLQPLKW